MAVATEIYTKTSYHWKCKEDCSREYSSYSPTDVAKDAEEHVDMHKRSKAVGKTLAGKVASRVNDKRLPFIGHISSTIDKCKELGITYFEFNGRVYPVWMDSFDDDMLCLAKDVPGLDF